MQGVLDSPFFARVDMPVPGPARDLIGYGEHPPQIEWPGRARVALQIVLNYEEGSEKSFPMGDGVNETQYEVRPKQFLAEGPSCRVYL